MLRPRIGCYAVYEVTEEGWENANEQLASICSDLESAGLAVVTAPEFVIDEASSQRVAAWFADKNLDIIQPLIITWSYDHLTYKIWQKVRVPVAIRCIPGIRTGSVVGGQQLGAILTDIQVEHKLFFGALGCAATAGKTVVYASACAIIRCLASSRILMLGRRTPGMTPTTFDEAEILERFGTVISTIGIDEFNRYTDTISNNQASDDWTNIAGKAAVNRCSQESGQASMKNYLAIKKLIKEQQIDAIAIGSYPDCQGTACLPISLLNAEGIVAGCEGDMNSTLAMYILSKLSSKPVLFGEMLDINAADNTIITSHCGAGPITLAAEDGYTLCAVRLANRGVCVRFRSMPGQVTYVNLLGRKGTYRMCAVEGEAIPTEMVFEGNPMKIRLKTPITEIWQSISEHGFSHHWMAVYGHVVPVLQEFCRMTKIKGVFPDLK